MAKWIDEFRRGWQGTSQPPLLLSVGFAAFCLVLATAARWGLSLIRPELAFAPYFPAVLFATTFGGFRIGLATAAAGGLLGAVVAFGDTPADSVRPALLLIYVLVSGLTIWGACHYRSIASHHREISKRLTEEETYRKLVVDELQHRLKNKLSTIHAVLRQVLHNQPQIWASIDGRIRALSATDELIARADGNGCDLRELLLSELGPYGHVRFTLNGEPLFLPAKFAVSLALIFHELATNAVKYGAFSAARGLLQVSWSVSDDRLTIVWDETEGPPIGAVGEPGFGTKLLNYALKPFDGKTEIAFLRSGVHCTLKCRIPRDLS
ncbi:sensor histidine kinase [Bradyrhizobium sp.]|uniref:sensor histidine kinase n=1 Tax=Bradyrhizobium sp. TaxID=376 RepID=UPI002E008B3B|nr:sensor histidine kinase [Bradyrhizobium sp.]